MECVSIRSVHIYIEIRFGIIYMYVILGICFPCCRVTKLTSQIEFIPEKKMYIFNNKHRHCVSVHNVIYSQFPNTQQGIRIQIHKSSFLASQLSLSKDPSYNEQSC